MASYDNDLQFSDLRYQIRNKRSASNEDYPPGKRQSMDWVSVERPDDRSTSLQFNQSRDEPFEIGGEWFQARVNDINFNEEDKRNSYFDEMSSHWNENQGRREFQSGGDFGRHMGESRNHDVGRGFANDRYSPERYPSRNEDFQGNDQGNRGYQEDRRSDDYRYHRERSDQSQIRVDRYDAEEYPIGADNRNYDRTDNKDFQSRNEGPSNNTLLGRRQEFQSHERQKQGRNNDFRTDVDRFRTEQGNHNYGNFGNALIHTDDERNRFEDKVRGGFQASRAQGFQNSNKKMKRKNHLERLQRFREERNKAEPRHTNIEVPTVVPKNVAAQKKPQGQNKVIRGIKARNNKPLASFRDGVRVLGKVRKYRWLGAWSRINNPKELVHLMADPDYGFFEMLEEDSWLGHDKVIMIIQTLRNMCPGKTSPMKQEVLQQLCESKNFLNKVSRHLSLYYMDRIEKRRPIALKVLDNILVICESFFLHMPRGGIGFLAVLLQAVVGAMSNLREFHNMVISEELSKKASNLTLKLIVRKMKNNKALT